MSLPAWLKLLISSLMALGGLVGLLATREGSGDLPGVIEHRWAAREVLLAAFILGGVGMVASLE
jgi:hypothetical protein